MSSPKRPTATGPRVPSTIRPSKRDVKETLAMVAPSIIPAFVLEKTQKVIAILCDMKRRGIIPSGTPIYSDSSTARDITSNLYRGTRSTMNDDAKALVAMGQHPLTCEGLREVSGKEALATHEDQKPSIYLSSSGMIEHASSPKQLESPDFQSQNLLAIVGWQAPAPRPEAPGGPR